MGRTPEEQVGRLPTNASERRRERDAAAPSHSCPFGFPWLPHAAIGTLLCLAVGCSVAGPAPGLGRGPLLVVRHEWHFADLDRAAVQERLNNDFRQIREAGFDTVWSDYSTDADLPVLRACALANDLRLAAGDAVVSRYVETGELPPGAASLTSLTAPKTATMTHDPDVVVLPPFPVDDMINRAREVASLLARSKPPRATLLVGLAADSTRYVDVPGLWYVPWEPVGHVGTTIRLPPRSLLLAARNLNNDTSWSETGIRLAYYRGLEAGIAGGLLIWRYASWPDESNGIAAPDGRIDPGTYRLLKSLAKRAREYGSLLSGAARIDDAPPLLEARRLQWAAYRRDGRRFIFIYNGDDQRFARGTLRLPSYLAGEPVARIVALDTGTRHTRAEGPLTIPVHVGPAEAVIYEVH